MHLTSVFFLMAAQCLAAPQDIDPNMITDIFGTPPPNGITVDPDTLQNVFGTPAQKLEDVTVRPTDSSTTFLDETGQACKCVPYYLCDSEKRSVENASITGMWELDIRFREDQCQESVEVCCRAPKNKEDVRAPAPDKSRLKGCGYTNPRGLDFSITGGSGLEAQFGEFPWVVALLNEQNGSYIGVGVLIHPSVVMTGAHIVYRYSGGGLRIRAGEWDTQTTKEQLQHEERIVQEIFVHPEFHEKALYNDIGLLRLEEPVTLSDHINVICMPEQDESFDDSKKCVANGWGKDVFGLPGRYAVILKKIQIDIVPNPICNQRFKKTRLGSRFKLHNTFVCAGGEEGMDTCTGDGGAPLVCPSGENRYTLTGLVAWGIGCGQKDLPAAYARVATFRNLVDQKMAEWGFETSGYSR